MRKVLQFMVLEGGEGVEFFNFLKFLGDLFVDGVVIFLRGIF